MSEKTMTLWDLTEDNGLLTDGDWVESKDQDPNGTISLIQLADVKDGYFQRKSDRYLNEKTAKRLNCTFIEEGDVLVARLPDPLGRACIYPGDDHKAITAVDVCIIRIDKTKYNNRWLTHLINNPHFRKEVNKFQSGTTRKRISKKNLSAIPFVVPKKNNQDAIADCIEAQFTRLDVAIKSLKAIKIKVELYRKSVLNAAFTGKLVDVVEWEETKVGDLGEIVTGTTPSKSKAEYYGNKYCFFKPTDLNAGYYVKRSHDMLSAKGVERARLLPERSILVTCIGATIGKTGFNRVDGATNQQINSVISDQSKYVPELLYYLFVSDRMQRQIKDNSSSTTLPILNKSKFSGLRVRIPIRKEEQSEIVNKIESCFSVIDKIEEVVDFSLAKSERLRKSILKSAFDGRLV